MTDRKPKPSKKAYDLDAPCDECAEPGYIYVCSTDRVLCANCYGATGGEAAA
jgi:ribosomal protein S27E